MVPPDVKAHKLLSLHARHANSRSTVIVSSPRWRKMESKIESPWREVESGRPRGSPGLISSCRAAVQCVASSCSLIVPSILRVTYIEPFTEYMCRPLDFRWSSSNYRKRHALASSWRLRVRRASTRPEEASSEQAGNTWTLAHAKTLAYHLYREVERSRRTRTTCWHSIRIYPCFIMFTWIYFFGRFLGFIFSLQSNVL